MSVPKSGPERVTLIRSRDKENIRSNLWPRISPKKTLDRDYGPLQYWSYHTRTHTCINLTSDYVSFLDINISFCHATASWPLVSIERYELTPVLRDGIYPNHFATA